MLRRIILAALALGFVSVAGAQTTTTLTTVPKGGTGVTSFTSNCIPYGAGTSALLCATKTDNGILTFNGSGVPTSSTTLPSAVQGNITTVGTVTSGTWTATVIGVAYGGTGLSSYTIGDLIYASGATTLSKLAGVATGNALISGGVATAPSWGKIGLATHISGTLAEGNGGTNQTTYAQGDLLYASAANVLGKLAKDTNATRYLSNTGTSNAPAWAQIALGTGVSGQLPVANGGTGLASGTSGGVLCFTGTTTGASSALLTQYGVVIGGGAGACPSSTAAGTSAQLLIGQSGAPTWNTVTGDVTIGSSGVTVIGSNKVTNAQLAQVATQTFKGRTSGSTGNVEDLNVTQATALLNAMVGDTGAGGTKGLVPAPGAGDAAAGKFLKADGTWDEPAGSGGGGLSNDDRRNILLDRGYLSKALGAPQRRINEWATGFKAATDADRGIASKTNVDVTNSAASGYIVNTIAAGTDQTATHTGATASGNTASASSEHDSGSFPAWKAFDKVTGSGSGTGNWISNSTTTGWLQYQFGSAKTIASYTIRSGNGFNTRAPRDWTLLGSNTGVFGGEETTLDTRAGETGWSAGGEVRSFSISSPGSFAYYRLNVTANNGDGSLLQIDEVTYKDADVINNMTLVTTSQTADATVGNVRVLLEYNPVDAITLNTDLTAEVTCNGGTNWASATLSAAGTAQNGRAVAETADTACTSGTSFATRLKTFNNKNVQIHVTTATVH